MNYCVGIDLGSTTTKALILDEDGGILGRGITNSRSNYKVACDVALGEALINARFALISRRLEADGVTGEAQERMLGRLGLRFREQQYRAQLRALLDTLIARITRTLVRGGVLVEDAEQPYLDLLYRLAL